MCCVFFGTQLSFLQLVYSSLQNSKCFSSVVSQEPISCLVRLLLEQFKIHHPSLATLHVLSLLSSFSSTGIMLTRIIGSFLEIVRQVSTSLHARFVKGHLCVGGISGTCILKMTQQKIPSTYLYLSWITLKFLTPNL